MAVERPQGDVIATYIAKFDADVERHPRGSEPLLKARGDFREKFGTRLGDGLFLALMPSLLGSESIDTLYDALAEEIATRFEGIHEDRVIATRAMLEMHRRTIEVSYRH